MIYQGNKIRGKNEKYINAIQNVRPQNTLVCSREAQCSMVLVIIHLVLNWERITKLKWSYFYTVLWSANMVAKPTSALYSLFYISRYTRLIVPAVCVVSYKFGCCLRWGNAHCQGNFWDVFWKGFTEGFSLRMPQEITALLPTEEGRRANRAACLDSILGFTITAILQYSVLRTAANLDVTK